MSESLTMSNAHARRPTNTTVTCRVVTTWHRSLMHARKARTAPSPRWQRLSGRKQGRDEHCCGLDNGVGSCVFPMFASLGILQPGMEHPTPNVRLIDVLPRRRPAARRVQRCSSCGSRNGCSELRRGETRFSRCKSTPHDREHRVRKRWLAGLARSAALRLDDGFYPLGPVPGR